MQESTIRRIATVQLIGCAIRDLSELIDKQLELARLEIRDGVWTVFRGVRTLVIGSAGLVLMTVALVVALVLAISLLSARTAFFLMGKGYQGVNALQGRLQGQQLEELPMEGAISSDGQEAA